MYQQPNYPVVQFMLRHGNVLAITIALVPVIAALIATALGLSFWIVAVAVLGGGLIGLLLKSYVEVLAIIADTLLPK